MTELEANYAVSSWWDLEELGVDLDNAHEWWIKWDTLHVQKEKDGEILEYPNSTNYEALKHPYSVTLDGVEVEN